ncbi:hypothetical protein EHO59_06330 [Leptospira semungkisensis]|uniref:DUF1640 domain-containing protein n=1 Tax=Leptospira semungkisensis TaxID=2484985 RepID=A0A4R9G8X8_9LEPT|nr:hypothetical protein [Leptospira semungkisensis]TGK07715.1 hypothetical protein EHO59_06330 [Leptospira semungkisensis]
MPAPMFQKIPRKLEELLGHDGSENFTDFLNKAFAYSKENVVEQVFERFERRLSEEINTFRVEMKTDMANLRSEFKTEMAEMKGELKGEISLLRADMYRLNSMQIKWSLATMVALTGIFALIVKV